MTQLRVLLETDRYDETCRFYGDALGFRIVLTWGEPDRGTIFGASVDGCVEVLESNRPASFGRTRIGVEVEDAESFLLRVEAAGVAIEEPLADQPWGHRSFSVRDPNGLPLVFFEVIGEDPADHPAS